MCCFEVIGPGDQVLRGAIYFVTGLTRLIQIQQNVLTLVFCDDDVDDDDRRAFSTHGRGCRWWSLRAVAPGRAIQVERTCPSTCIDVSNIHVTKLARRLASSPDFPQLFVAFVDSLYTLYIRFFGTTPNSWFPQSNWGSSWFEGTEPPRTHGNLTVGLVPAVKQWFEQVRWD